MNDRIKLAEAMGWKKACYAGHGVCWKSPHGEVYRLAPDSLPDPFTDANDDYAVLEWMRNPEGDGKFHPNWSYFCDILEENMTYDYDIGDFARAALKVLDE